MRLLKEDEVLDIIERVTNDAVENKKPKYLIQKRIIAEIAALDPVDAELVKHGQWEWEPGYVGTEARCSVCKRSPMGFYSLSKFQIGRLPEYPFCPKCGARMDGEEE